MFSLAANSRRTTSTKGSVAPMYFAVDSSGTAATSIATSMKWSTPSSARPAPVSIVSLIMAILPGPDVPTRPIYGFARRRPPDPGAQVATPRRRMSPAVSSRACRRRGVSGCGGGQSDEPERHPLHSLHEVVDRFGRTVRHAGEVPGADLGAPLADGAAEAAHFERHLAVGEVTHDLIHPLDSEAVIGVGG